MYMHIVLWDRGKVRVVRNKKEEKGGVKKKKKMRTRDEHLLPAAIKVSGPAHDEPCYRDARTFDFFFFFTFAKEKNK